MTLDPEAPCVLPPLGPPGLGVWRGQQCKEDPEATSLFQSLCSNHSWPAVTSSPHSCLVYENVSFLFGKHFWQKQNQRKGARMTLSHPHCCFFDMEVEPDRFGVSVSEEALQVRKL